MMIEVKNLKKSFGNNQVLRGIDVEIHKGEVVVVIGPSGSGKSTFLRCFWKSRTKEVLLLRARTLRIKRLT